jgi:nucleotide-binding universal stress UspA family protein
MDLTGAGTGTLLVPLDGSRLAEAALPYALGLAGATGARVLLLHVAPDALLPLPKTLDLEATAREARRAAAGAPQGIAVETSVGCGDPALVIADVAAVRRVSLIVMTTHGRSGLGRWLYGSVADAALRVGDLAGADPQALVGLALVAFVGAWLWLAGAAILLR